MEIPRWRGRKRGKRRKERTRVIRMQKKDFSFSAKKKKTYAENRKGKREERRK
jgi:hypothetical protein